MRRSKLAAFVVLLLSVLSQSQAQVTGMPMPSLGITAQIGSTDTFFIAPRPGVLGFMPEFVIKFRNPLPDTAHFAIQLPDTTYTPSVFPYLPHYVSDTTSRDSCGISLQTSYHFYQRSEGTARFYTKLIQTGDTVRFALYAEFYDPTTVILDPTPDSVWEAVMHKPLPPGCKGSHFPDEYCFFGFFFADTLVKFTTPDTSAYPTYPGHNNTPATRNYVDLELGVEYADNPDVPSSCRTPDNNHFAAQIVRDSLPLMVNVWVDSLGQDTLFINDISLPYGGLFDHLGTWAPPHGTHREGLDVDIRTELLTLTPPRQGVKVRDDEGESVGNREFEKLAKRFAVRRPRIHDEGTNNEHYHLYYRSP